MSTKQRVITTKTNYKKRILACLINYGILVLVTSIFFLLFGKPYPKGGFVLDGIPFYLIIFLWFALTIISEQVLGASIGNLSVGLKAISLSNSDEKLGIDQSIKRHLLDIIDISFFGLIGFLSIRNTRYNQRLGDIWSKSIVIDKGDKNQGITWE